MITASVQIQIEVSLSSFIWPHETQPLTTPPILRLRTRCLGGETPVGIVNARETERGPEEESKGEGDTG